MLSLIIPVYNRPDEVEELLHSLAQQQTPPSYEVVIVEDGSTVPCAAVVDRYRDLMSIHYEVVPNGGPSRARNIGGSSSLTRTWCYRLTTYVMCLRRSLRTGAMRGAVPMRLLRCRMAPSVCGSVRSTMR